MEFEGKAQADGRCVVLAFVGKDVDAIREVMAQFLDVVRGRNKRQGTKEFLRVRMPCGYSMVVPDEGQMPGCTVMCPCGDPLHVVMSVSIVPNREEIDDRSAVEAAETLMTGGGEDGTEHLGD